jgi:uncharacterized membrane protein
MIYKYGVLLILVGIFLPIATLPFIDNYSPFGGVVFNMRHAKVTVFKKEAVYKYNPVVHKSTSPSNKYEEILHKMESQELVSPSLEIIIFYRYVILIGLLLVLSGSIIILFNKKASDTTNYEN